MLLNCQSRSRGQGLLVMFLREFVVKVDGNQKRYQNACTLQTLSAAAMRILVKSG